MRRTNDRRRPAFALALLCALTTAGCLEEPPMVVDDPDQPFAPPFLNPDALPRQVVTGTVTMDGEPLTGASIAFTPLENGKPVVGRTDDGGHYQLMTGEIDAGVVPGIYRVSISKTGAGSGDGTAGPESIPQAYNVGTVLAVDVRFGAEVADFNLRSDVGSRWYQRVRSLGTEGRPPNIVLIVADGLGSEWIGCYGGLGVATPHIDSLATSGLKFTNFYAMPQPAPARVSLLTGQYPCRHGWIGDWNVPQAGRGCWFDWDQHFSVARRLTGGGFNTCIVGQWQLNDFRFQPDALLQHGFRRWCVWTGAERGNPPSREWNRNAHVYLNGPLVGHGERWPTANVRQYDWGAAGNFVGESGPDVTNRFVPNLFRRRYESPPFFLYYPITLPATPESSTPDATGPADATERHRAMVQHTDNIVGELLTRLDEGGRRRRTIVIFTSDGGDPPPIAGRADGRDAPAGRNALTERGVCVPLIISVPLNTSRSEFIRHGIETDCLADVTDLAPTLCDLALLERTQGAHFDGRSLAPVIVGEQQASPRDWIMAMSGRLEFDGQQVRAAQPFAERVLRDQRYKVHVNTGRAIDALFDLSADPTEEHNLIDSSAPEHRGAIDKFRAIVEKLPEQDAALRYAPLPELTRSQVSESPIERAGRRQGG